MTRFFQVRTARTGEDSVSPPALEDGYADEVEKFIHVRLQRSTARNRAAEIAASNGLAELGKDDLIKEAMREIKRDPSTEMCRALAGTFHRLRPWVSSAALGSNAQRVSLGTCRNAQRGRACAAGARLRRSGPSVSGRDFPKAWAPRP